jgi:hypothetical protein
MKTILLCVLLLPCLLKAETKFVVYQVKGNVSVTQNNVTSALKIGQLFNDANVAIHVSYNSSAILICNNYSLINLTSPNTYSLFKLNDSCREPVSSVTSVYFRFVWDELTQAHVSIEENRRKYMHNVGAVTRGCEGLQFFTNYDTINYAGGFFPVKWTSASTAPQKLVLYNDETAELPLLKIDVAGDLINLNTIKDSLKAAGEYYWNIKINNSENCPRKYLKLWDEKSFQSFCDSIKNVIPANIDDAEKMYMLAFILEYNYFYAESYNYYKLANDKNPSDKKYQNSIQLFMKTYFDN